MYFENDDVWNKIVEYGIATDDELQLVTSINGYNRDTLNNVIYVRTGYRTFEQFFPIKKYYDELQSSHVKER